MTDAQRKLDKRKKRPRWRGQPVCMWENKSNTYWDPSSDEVCIYAIIAKRWCCCTHIHGGKLEDFVLLEIETIQNYDSFSPTGLINRYITLLNMKWPLVPVLNDRTPVSNDWMCTTAFFTAMADRWIPYCAQNFQHLILKMCSEVINLFPDM